MQPLLKLFAVPCALASLLILARTETHSPPLAAALITYTLFVF